MSLTRRRTADEMARHEMPPIIAALSSFFELK